MNPVFNLAAKLIVSALCATFFCLSAVPTLTAMAAQGDKTSAATGSAVGQTASPRKASSKGAETATSESNASAPVKAPDKNTALESEVNATAEPPSDDPQKQPKGLLVLRLFVPQMQKRVDTFSINPYTTDLPPIAILPAPLPESFEGVRYKVIQSGYSMRLSLTKPYPDSGWRWNYAYRNARKKSGITEPHAFFQIYHFADDLTPYVMAECKRINKIENARLKAYMKAKQEHEDNHKDEEMEALRLGLEPVKLNLTPIKRGDAIETSLYISPGDWWITGTHKVPGLIYFWQLPIKVKAGESQTIELTDANALLIQGGW
ncbi:MAG: hypothetical protein KGS72_18910 [Cyanobacteria bacterium REEB67]|nr:hypothetical protein [Cyanobacteria bacterium REEB67]